MMKFEFEKMAIRGGATISGLLYDCVEHFYMSENDYHRYHGGINESKQDFIKRVYGGKVNTPKTILEKTIREAQKENRYALSGCNVSKQRLDEMDYLIAQHYGYLAKHDY